jgi:hypothetical protein
MKTEPSYYSKKTIFSRFINRFLPFLKTDIVLIFGSIPACDFNAYIYYSSSLIVFSFFFLERAPIT